MPFYASSFLAGLSFFSLMLSGLSGMCAASGNKNKTNGAEALAALRTGIAQGQEDRPAQWLSQLGLSQTMQALASHEGVREQSLNFGAQLLRLGPQYNFSVRSSWSYLTHDSFQQGWDWQDSTLNLSARPKSWGGVGLWSPSMTLLLPTSPVSREQEGLYAGVMSGLNWTLPAGADSFWKHWIMTAGAQLGQFFYEFETNPNGQILNKNTFSTFVFFMRQSERWSFSWQSAMRWRLNYQGELNQAYDHNQEVSYLLSPQWTVSFGHAYADSVLKPNGQDYNWALMTEENSRVYWQLSVLL